MRAEAQTDFSGGMCDPGRGSPANSYALGVNIDLDRSGRIVRRPLARFTEQEAVEGGPVPEEILHVAALDSALLGYIYLRIWRAGTKISATALKVGEDGSLEEAMTTKFGTAAYPLGASFLDEDDLGALEHVSTVQIGQSVFVFFMFAQEFRVYSGAMSGFFGLPGTPGTVLFRRTYPVPTCRAAVYGFSRVWLAARLTAGAPYFHVAVSDRVDGEAPAPDLAFGSPLLAVDDNTSSDILGFCPLGTSMLVFKRFSVWQILGADGEPGAMRVRLVTDQAGAVGPAAFLASGGYGYFVSGGGLNRVDAGGRVGTLTGPLAETWRARVPFTGAEYAGVSLCAHGGRILASVPYDASGEAGQGEEETGTAVLVYAAGLERVVAFWTGEGFGGLLAGATERGSRSAYCFSDGGTLEIFPEWVWSDGVTVHDELELSLETRDLAPGPGRHFVAGLRLSVANLAAADGEVYPAQITVTFGLQTQTKTVTGACAELAFHFCRKAEAIAFRIEAAGGLLVIEAATVTYVLR